MESLARWCYRHRLVVLVLWVVALIGPGVLSSVKGSDYTNDFSLPDTDSRRGYDLLVSAFPDASGDPTTIVWRTADGSVRDPAVRGKLEPALAEIAGMKGIGKVVSPYTPAGANAISSDGRSAYATVVFKERAEQVPKELVEAVMDRAEDARGDGLRVELGGQPIVHAAGPPGGTAELVGIVAAAIVLFLAFGSLFAMLLPLVTALFGVGIGLILTGLISNGTDLATVAPLIGSLVGLGVGIDYALFIVTRHRRGLLNGRAPEESAVTALNTSGRAVLFAGATVCIALAGMLVTGIGFLNGIVIAASLTVVLSVLAAVTLLPALLGLLGIRVLSRKQRRALRDTAPAGADADAGADTGSASVSTGAAVGDEAPSGAAARWSAFVERRPRAVGAVALLVMTILALPVLSLRLGATDHGNHHESTTTRKAYDLLADGFGPGFNGPLQIVVDGASPAEVTALAERAKAMKGVVRAEVMPTPPGTGVSVIGIIPATAPQDAATYRLIDDLRSEVVAPSGQTAHVGGVTAVFKDFAEVTTDRLPYFIITVVGLGCLLLLIAFRSLGVPLLAAVMNLIAAAASFGVLVAIFQWGWGSELIGFGKEGPISAFLPAIMLSLLFGLSMDYQVFLVSRMHEEWVHTGDNARAVRTGLAETSRVINSAALIMICVFAAFVFSGDTEAAMVGAGLAVAVALDAFVLRTALVPAAMHLLGRANWWLPGFLDRILPHFAVEPKEEPVPPARLTAAGQPARKAEAVEDMTAAGSERR
ncbi:MMPL family transporter [Streptomyces qinzhouensis]|uniref:MMPL family transporter n=1 Tax=Streptomyces qinzhouensis TaxID=2599401 RepID=A0A5B8IJ93_9ACTN|nr:MMPL family transporter [Streptomyces qinzhouensis]QDY78638.1 MMPL family transporter [Streptomyces qinzhouensis]